MTSPVVLDASLAFVLVTGEPTKHDISAAATAVADYGAVAPHHWEMEIANALAMATRAKRLTVAERDVALSDLGVLAVTLDQTQMDVFGALIRLADKHRLTIYDAAYLQLAMRTGYPLASLDQELRAAATAEGVAVLPA